MIKTILNNGNQPKAYIESNYARSQSQITYNGITLSLYTNINIKPNSNKINSRPN